MASPKVDEKKAVESSLGESKGDMALAEESLVPAFLDVQATYQTLLKEGHTGDKAQDKLKRAMTLMKAVYLGVRQSGLFSKNEEADDIKTEDLRFILTEFYLASLTSMIQWADRLDVLRQARLAYAAFLILCQRYKLLPKDELALLSSDEAPKSIDAGTMRAAKIARYKARKEAESELARMIAIEKRAAERERGGAGRTIDEDDQRKMTMLMIENSIRTTIDEMSTMEQEIKLLEFRDKSKASEKGLPERGADPATDPSRKGLEIMRIDPTFKVTREVVKAGVFKYGHRLPTMTLEELAEIEMFEAEMRAEKTKEAEKTRVMKLDEVEERGLEDDEEKYDAATERARAWDDWKDEHPRGAGNTKRY